MTSILSLGRSRLGALFAWLALLSMGALGTLHDPARAADGAAKVVSVRALVDAPAQIGRLAAVKLTPLRTGDGGHGPAGPDPLTLVTAIVLAGRAAEAIVYMALPRAKAAGGHGTPYAARAPPFHPIR
jgi:hypothetical protein